MLEFLLDKDEAKAVIRALEACDGLYKEDTPFYDIHMRMLGYFKYELEHQEKRIKEIEDPNYLPFSDIKEEQ